MGIMGPLRETYRKALDYRIEDPVRLIKWALAKLNALWVSAVYPFEQIGKHVQIHYSCDLARRTAHRIRIGNDVKLQQDVWINISAPEKRGSTVLAIDDGCVIARRSTISARNHVHLERNVIFGPSVLIMDHAHAYADVTQDIKAQGVTEGGTIKIGEGCWVGQGAAIICNSGELVLGRNCVVAANSYITRSFPSYCVIAGNPARIVKQFDHQKGRWVLGAHSPDQGVSQKIIADENKGPHGPIQET